MTADLPSPPEVSPDTGREALAAEVLLDAAADLADRAEQMTRSITATPAARSATFDAANWLRDRAAVLSRSPERATAGAENDAWLAREGDRNPFDGEATPVLERATAGEGADALARRLEAAWRSDPLIRIALDVRSGSGVHPDHLGHMANVAASAVNSPIQTWHDEDCPAQQRTGQCGCHYGMHLSAALPAPAAADAPRPRAALERALARHEERAAAARGYEASRLTGKVEGIRLALAYLPDVAPRPADAPLCGHWAEYETCGPECAPRPADDEHQDELRRRIETLLPRYCDCPAGSIRADGQHADECESQWLRAALSGEAEKR